MRPDYAYETDVICGRHCKMLRDYFCTFVLDGGTWMTQWGVIPPHPGIFHNWTEIRDTGKFLLNLIERKLTGLEELTVEKLSENMKKEWFIEKREKKFTGMTDEEIVKQFLSQKEKLEQDYKKMELKIKKYLGMTEQPSKSPGI